MSKKVLVTTPIYYPNDKLHVGHAYTTSLADAIARFHRLEGSEVYFITGSDEHGQKIEDKAKEMNRDTYEYVSEIVDSFKGLWTKLNISNDLFIRTTDKKHEEYVSNAFTQLQELGFIYKGEYEGNYCKSCEEFWTDTQIGEDKTCPSCGKKTEVLAESSYFLKVSEFQDWIEDQLKNHGILEPQFKAKELINNFIKDGLQDLSITRTSFSWGIPVPGDEKHVIYVWLDALLNYVSALTYDESPFTIDDIWAKDSEAQIVQLAGKEITRFHSIYWPIMLNMLGYRTPKVYAHGWLLKDGEKMSKSKGNVVDPIELIDEFGSDAVRFYLAAGVSFGDDGNVSSELVKEMTNGILVNKYSNLISRTQAMLEQKRELTVPSVKNRTNESTELLETLDQYKVEYDKLFNSVKLTDVTKVIVKALDKVNGYIDITEPWKKDGEELDLILNDLVHSVIKVTLMIHPFIPTFTEEVFEAILDKKEASFKDWNIDLSNKKISKVENLFMRIK